MLPADLLRLGAGAAVFALMWWLRSRDRRLNPIEEEAVEDTEVFCGPGSACRQAVDHLAEAGIAAWTEADGRRVLVDADLGPEAKARLKAHGLLSGG